VAIIVGENCGISTIFNRENLIIELEMKWSNLITNFEINTKYFFSDGTSTALLADK
jgi:hypothetical protein